MSGHDEVPAEDPRVGKLHAEGGEDAEGPAEDEADAGAVRGGGAVGVGGGDGDLPMSHQWPGAEEGQWAT